MNSETSLPIHSLTESEHSVLVRSVDYRNQYDFTQRHRHDYFELIFFESGGGKQLIDFTEYTVRDSSCYLIQPKQIHLLDRAEKSKGRLLQFNSESIESSRLHRLLHERIWHGKGAAIFEDSPELLSDFNSYLDLIEKNSLSTYRYKKETTLHMLQALLFNLLSVQFLETATSPPDKDFSLFLSLVDHYHESEHGVGFYVERLHISQKKLSTLCKKYHGLTPLQVIHNRILLEAKRLLTFGERSHKEISLDLGFDSPASFSSFIKKKTGQTASELQADIAKIHSH